MTSRCSSEMKSHMSLTLNQKLEMIKLSEEGMWQAQTGQKLDLLCQLDKLKKPSPLTQKSKMKQQVFMQQEAAADHPDLASTIDGSGYTKWMFRADQVSFYWKEIPWLEKSMTGFKGQAEFLDRVSHCRSGCSVMASSRLNATSTSRVQEFKTSLANMVKPCLYYNYKNQSGVVADVYNRLRQESTLNLGGGGCSEPRSCHYTPAWTTDISSTDKGISGLSLVQWFMPVIPALWEAKTGGSPEVASSRPACPTWRNPIATKNNNNELGVVAHAIIPATREAEAGESQDNCLNPGESRSVTRLECSGATLAHCNLRLAGPRQLHVPETPQGLAHAAPAPRPPSPTPAARLPSNAAGLPGNAAHPGPPPPTGKAKWIHPTSFFFCPPPSWMQRSSSRRRKGKLPVGRYRSRRPACLRREGAPRAPIGAGQCLLHAR
ncbi:putative uncharacterized protein C8orf44 [Plecturocebus cupreus]